MQKRKKRKNRIPSNVVLNSNILPQVYAKQSKFNISEGHKTTINAGDLVPIYWEEMSPGDHFTFKINGLFRLTTPIVPIMDNLRVKIYSFFVPNRLLWEHWENFMGQALPDGTIKDYTVPQVKIAKGPVMGLADYLGVPVGLTPELKVSALPFRAYNKIWNENFRCEYLQKEKLEIVSDADVAYNNRTDDKNYPNNDLYEILKKGKQFDYFTSALPAPQVGDPVTIPITGNAPITVDVLDNNELVGIKTTKYLPGIHGLDTDDSLKALSVSSRNVDVKNLMYADMSQVQAVDIEDLRNAFMVQRILEKDMQGGSRYIEQIRSHWNVINPDYRLQRSHLIKKIELPVTISPVVQTSGTNAGSPQGNLAAVGVGGVGKKFFSYPATEHGILMVLACFDGDITYQNGLPKKFSKLRRFDYCYPEFANLGEEPIYMKELYCTGTATDDEVFGYQERYRYLKEGVSKITGKMRSGVEGSLDVWHLAENFTSKPTLSSEFIKVDLPIKRVLAVQDEPDLICDFWFDIQALRELPKRANPGNLRL